MLDYVSKAEHSSVPGDSTLPAKLRVASGLAHLGEGRFGEAAQQLTAVVPPEVVTTPFCSPEDVALYAILCAIASLDRNRLLVILESQSFELVPTVRDALQRFCRADYPNCLAILQQQLPILQLDVHLAPHLDELMETILHKCLVEYMRPYRKVSLPDMATQFGVSLERLFSTLATLIRTDKIKYARLDYCAQTLEKHPELEVVERREKTTRRIVALQDGILNDAYAMMVRMACLEHDLTVDRRKASYDNDDTHQPMDLVANPEESY